MALWSFLITYLESWFETAMTTYCETRSTIATKHREDNLKNNKPQ